MTKIRPSYGVGRRTRRKAIGGQGTAPSDGPHTFSRLLCDPEFSRRPEAVQRILVFPSYSYLKSHLGYLLFVNQFLSVVPPPKTISHF
jgi:hypothetical protein